jgi:hypothetical protein
VSQPDFTPPLPPPLLFHVREGHLPSGSLIQPGRWGSTILGRGEDHPFYFREHLLEVWRRLRTSIPVSRWNCTFSFERRADAETFAETGQVVLPVVPADRSAPHARLDMLWLTWLGEPGKTTDQVMFWCCAYWEGRSAADIKPTAVTTWEWLYACPLRVS